MLDKISVTKLHPDHPDIVALRHDLQAHIAQRPFGKQGFPRDLTERVRVLYERERDMLDGVSHKALGGMLGISKYIVWRAVNIEYEKQRYKEVARVRKTTRPEKERTLPLATAMRAVRMARPSVSERDPAYVESLARALEERNRRLNQELAMTPAQVLMGEPPPGRSALDQRRASMQNQQERD